MIIGTSSSSIESSVKEGRLIQVPRELDQKYRRNMQTGVIKTKIKQLMDNCRSRMVTNFGVGFSICGSTPS